MSILDLNGKKVKVEEKESYFSNALFRWIILLLTVVASKVLTTVEAEAIFGAVLKHAKESKEVREFHNRLLEMIKELEGEKNE